MGNYSTKVAAGVGVAAAARTAYAGAPNGYTRDADPFGAAAGESFGMSGAANAFNHTTSRNVAPAYAESLPSLLFATDDEPVYGRVMDDGVPPDDDLSLFSAIALTAGAVAATGLAAKRIVEYENDVGGVQAQQDESPVLADSQMPEVQSEPEMSAMQEETAQHEFQMSAMREELTQYESETSAMREETARYESDILAMREETAQYESEILAMREAATARATARATAATARATAATARATAATARATARATAATARATARATAFATARATAHANALAAEAEEEAQDELEFNEWFQHAIANHVDPVPIDAFSVPHFGGA